MNKVDYLNKIYALLTPEQTALFDKMYVGGVKPDQLDWAIKQIENTIGRLNEVNEKTRKEMQDLKIEVSKQRNKYNEEQNKVIVLSIELQNIKSALEIINKLNPKSTDTNERLAKLDALEAGGVDNWVGYDDSLEEAGL